ncbi:hypothetical protein B0H63DRAFT_494827 [Podospora didyma]|uniref:Heterokaryon incompatibility domain-containing protein n=1 Tax=Podospora didyma TaxID=330526 RepID=A0AAE0NFW6_9PEZI|nr:hypothetical protein B0H63DRAFT_494827 [Podospora didyma]
MVTLGNWAVTVSEEKLVEIKRLMVVANVQYMWVDCVRLNQDDNREKSFDPQHIVDDLKSLDNVLYYMAGAAVASDAMLAPNVLNQLRTAAAVEPGLLNCYATCISHIRTLSVNLYFSRVWTFQEMILGKITMWGFDTWMELAKDATDKAIKLEGWLQRWRQVTTTGFDYILIIIQEDKQSLGALRTQVEGIISARIDIINGGPRWWDENYKGVINIFSAMSIRPREAKMSPDIFRGLLGADIVGDDLEQLSFAFFKQLSLKTGYAWTRLAVSSKERGEWDWIPVLAARSKPLTTHMYTGVFRLGRLKPNGRIKTIATTGIKGTPEQYVTVLLREGPPEAGTRFVFEGCNCGKKLKTRLFSRETWSVTKQVTFTDAHAKPVEWIDRCVNGTVWENPSSKTFRAHNVSINFYMVDVTGCQSRLYDETTKNRLCQLMVQCGCTVTAPYYFIMKAITAVNGSSLGDGLGLVQAGDVGKGFHLMAFGGEPEAYRTCIGNGKKL